MLNDFQKHFDKFFGHENTVIDVVKIKNFTKMNKQCNDCKVFFNHPERGIIEIDTSFTNDVVMNDNYKCCNCKLKVSHAVFTISPQSNDKDKVLIFFVNYDGRTITEFNKDHIIPKSLGGSNSINNMQSYCIKCNLAKGNTIEDIDVAGIIKEQVGKKQEEILEKVLSAFEDAPFYLKLLGLGKVVNKLLGSLNQK